MLEQADYDTLPEQLRPLYVEKNGKWVLDVSGGLVEVAGLKRELADADTRLKAYETVDVETYQAQDARINELERENATLKSTTAQAQTAAADAILRSTVADAFVRQGRRVDATEFIVQRAKAIFAVENGTLTTTEYSTSRPGEALTLDEWVAAQAHNAPYVFLPSSGGGARGSRRGGSGKPTLSRDQIGAHLADVASGRVTVEG